MMTASEMPWAMCCVYPASTTSTGTMMMPPPPPNRPENTPTTTPTSPNTPYLSGNAFTRKPPEGNLADQRTIQSIARPLDLSQRRCVLMHMNTRTAQGKRNQQASAETPDGRAAAVKPASGRHATMGKALSILIGLIFIALGVWGVISWRPEVVQFIKAALVILAIVIGLGIFVFGLSELRSGADEPPVA